MRKFKKLYSDTDLHMLRVSEESRMQGKNRIEEIIRYAQKAGVKRVGIAHCIAMRKEAEKLKNRLSDAEVFSIDCSTGRLPASELMNKDTRGIICNSAGQAEYLAKNKTELNVSMGLCIGHDIMFSQKSKAPVTTLIVKDRQHNHNPYKEFESEANGADELPID